MKEIVQLFEKYANCSVSSIERLMQSGSNRQYFRILGANHTSVIGVVGTSEKENNAFIKIAQQFENQGINAPKVLAVSDDLLCYLQTDLGDKNLFDEIGQGRASGIFSDYEKQLLHKTISYLPDIQFKIAQNFDFSVCFPQPEFDRRNIFFDLNYFKYNFLKFLGIEFDEIELEKDFEKLSEILLQHSDTETFMYRDFQSRNIILKEGEPYFIDFQGGRKGAIYYDVASFLWQAKANFPDQLRNELIDTYLKNLSRHCGLNYSHSVVSNSPPLEGSGEVQSPESTCHCGLDPQSPEYKQNFLKNLRYFVLFRQLQTLGAYGFRGIFEQKQHFLQSIPFALENIKKLLPFEEFPYLLSIILSISKKSFEINCHCGLDPQSFEYHYSDINSSFQVAEMKNKSNLTVQIESFSYKKGLPQDNSGNGGGYIFDCRAIYNPGRFEEYKNLTGLDEPVKEFIEKSTNINEFLQNVYSLIDKHIEVFLERKFTHLSVFFGCTGGQHRSVYCAERLAEYLKKYNVIIDLKHRELS